jgi:hypothetical protein
VGTSVSKLSVYKPVPLVPSDETLRVGYVTETANSFPNPKIVHEGMEFSEETGWQPFRQTNVFFTFKITSIQALISPNPLFIML